MTDGPSTVPPAGGSDPKSDETEPVELAPSNEPAQGAVTSDDSPPTFLPDDHSEESPWGEFDLGGSMTFLQHLDELRKRIVHSAISVAIAFCFCWAFSEQIFRFLAVPIADVVGGVDQLIFMMAARLVNWMGT